MARSSCASRLWLAVSVGAFALGWTAACWATIVTFQFGGPAEVFVPPGPAIEAWLAGRVTYDTAASAVDARGPFDQGDRLFYAGAITNFSFATEGISRSFTSGGIQLWNDYQYCLAHTATECVGPYQKEPDRLYFSHDPFMPDVSLVISGLDWTFLSSGRLPEAVPIGPYIASFFWDGGDNPDDYPWIASNHIQLAQVRVAPESGTLPLLGLGLGGLALTRRISGGGLIPRV